MKKSIETGRPARNTLIAPFGRAGERFARTTPLLTAETSRRDRDEPSISLDTLAHSTSTLARMMAKRGNHSRSLTKAQLRAKYTNDRREGRLLQKKGLLSPRANLTRAKPSLAVRKKIASLQGIFNGTQQAVEITDVQRPKLKASGYRVIGRKVIFDKQPRQRFKRRRNEFILEENNIGRDGDHSAFETVMLPLDVRSLPDFAEWIRKDPDRFMALLPPGTAFAFSFHGHNSRQIFSDPLELADYLESYFAGADAWQHFLLYRLINPGEWRGGTGQRNYKRKSGKQSNRSREYKRYYQHNRERKIAYMRDYRAKRITVLK